MGNAPEKQEESEPEAQQDVATPEYEQQSSYPYMSSLHSVQPMSSRSRARLVSDVPSPRENNRKGIQVHVAVNEIDALPVTYYQGETSRWLVNQFISKARDYGFELRSRPV